MNSPAQILKKLILFLLIFIGIYSISCLYIPQQFISKNQTGNFGNTLERFREIKSRGNTNIDLLFVGASNCYRTFDNRIYAEQGISSFTLGTTSQTPFNSFFLLKEYLNKLNPKVVVLEVSSGTFELENGIESFLNIAVNHDLSKNIIDMGVTANKVICYNTLYSEYLKRKLLKPLDLYKDKTRGTKYIKGGYSEDTRTFEDYYTYALNDFEISVSERQIKALESIIDLVKKNNVKLVLTIQPKPELFYQKCKNYNAYLRRIKSIAKKEEVTFIEVGDIGLNNQLNFVDILHLNNSGAHLFNKVLLVGLKKELI